MMGKIKAMAKYRLVGKMMPVVLIFFLIASALFILGNFSFIIGRIFSFSGLDLGVDVTGNVVSAALSLIGILMCIMVVSPLRLGSERWFLMRANGDRTTLKDLFFYFSISGMARSINAVMFTFIKKLSALMLFMFPSACLFVVLYFSFGEGEISLYISYMLFGTAFFLALIGLIFYFIYTSRFLPYYSIIVANQNIGSQDALKKSIEITEGAYIKICFFRLSFVPWFLVCALVVPSFYVWGYYKESKAMLSLRNEYLHT